MLIKFLALYARQDICTLEFNNAQMPLLDEKDMLSAWHNLALWHINTFAVALVSMTNIPRTCSQMFFMAILSTHSLYTQV